MSFTVDVVERAECEKCRQPSKPENPVLQLWQATRSDKNIIYIHQNCLNRAVEKAVGNAAIKSSRDHGGWKGEVNGD